MNDWDGEVRTGVPDETHAWTGQAAQDPSERIPERDEFMRRLVEARGGRGALS